jgi:hypothetical protein
MMEKEGRGLLEILLFHFILLLFCCVIWVVFHAKNKSVPPVTQSTGHSYFIYSLTSLGIHHLLVFQAPTIKAGPSLPAHWAFLRGRAGGSEEQEEPMQHNPSGEGGHI